MKNDKYFRILLGNRRALKTGILTILITLSISFTATYRFSAHAAMVTKTWDGGGSRICYLARKRPQLLGATERRRGADIQFRLNWRHPGPVGLYPMTGLKKQA
jgi:hypothetical protein